MMISHDIYDRFTMEHFSLRQGDRIRHLQSIVSVGQELNHASIPLDTVHKRNKTAQIHGQLGLKSIHFVLNFSRSGSLNFGTVIMFCK
jgi:hypothetical protein